jgi:hypothetical protein
MDVWAEVVNEAQAAYDRSDACTFTTFPGYEWSGNPAGKNLHRNVMFKNENVTELPYGYFDEPYAEGLWAQLREGCIDAGNGCDTLTIPHNSNLSEGIYFENTMANGEPFSAEYVVTRAAMEPVIEIYQHKGNSECYPGEITEDELCGFEVIPFSNLGTTNGSQITQPDPRGFLRHAYGEGMKLERSLGTNPFQYGITAATDTHISAPGLVAEDDFKGRAASPRFGPKRTPAKRSSRRFAARRHSAPAAHGSSSACSAVGTTRATCAMPTIWKRRATRAAFRWGEHSLHSLAPLRRSLSCQPDRTR